MILLLQVIISFGGGVLVAFFFLGSLEQPERNAVATVST
jgi:hypothetical protein